MGADDQVDRAVGQTGRDLPFFLGRAKPAEHFDAERVFAHPAAERAAMLGGQHGRRHEHGHLVTGIDGLERSRMASSVLP